MSKKEPPKKIRYCVVICESLNNDHQSASVNIVLNSPLVMLATTRPSTILSTGSPKTDFRRPSSSIPL